MAECSELYDTIFRQSLYHFAGAQDLRIESDDWVICTNFPKTYHRDRTLTLEKANLVSNVMVFVEEVLPQ